MTIRITVADRTQFGVRGTIANESGSAESFDFKLTARRLGTAALQDALAVPDRRVEDFLAELALDWRGVLDEQGDEVPFSTDALRRLFDAVPGVAGIAFRAYVDANGAKEKN